MSIKQVIKQRLAMQSTAKTLWQDFQLPQNLDYILNPSFTTKYKNWPQEKQKKFIILLGGRINFKQTKELIENM